MLKSNEVVSLVVAGTSNYGIAAYLRALAYEIEKRPASSNINTPLHPYNLSVSITTGNTPEKEL